MTAAHRDDDALTDALLAALITRLEASSDAADRLLLGRAYRSVQRHAQSTHDDPVQQEDTWRQLLDLLQRPGVLAYAELDARLKDVEAATNEAATDPVTDNDPTSSARLDAADAADAPGSAFTASIDPDLDTALFLRAEAAYGFLDADEAQLAQLAHALTQGPLTPVDSPNAASDPVVQELSRSIATDVDRASLADYGYGYRYGDENPHAAPPDPALDDPVI